MGMQLFGKNYTGTLGDTKPYSQLPTPRSHPIDKALEFKAKF